MSRIKQIAIVSTFVLIAFVAVRHYRHQQDRAKALSVITDLGGTVGSLPFEPIASEYRVTFRNRFFSRDDLERLVVLNPLSSRNAVGILFENCGLTPADIEYVRQLLPNIRVFDVVNEPQIEKPRQDG